MPHLNPFKPHAQSGLAALEFALLAALVMIPMLLGILMYWEILQAQQVLTRATGDGARHMHQLMQNGASSEDAVPHAQDLIHAALENYLPDDIDMQECLPIALTATAQGLALEATYKINQPGCFGNQFFPKPNALTARSILQVRSKN